LLCVWSLILWVTVTNLRLHVKGVGDGVELCDVIFEWVQSIVTKCNKRGEVIVP